MLTDNGKQFTGRFPKPRPLRVLFERVCREHGITAKLTKPYSPTTTRKVERWHQTLRRELLDVAGPFVDLPTAQAAITAWVHTYNYARPHQALGIAKPTSMFRPGSQPGLILAGSVPEPAPEAPGQCRGDPRRQPQARHGDHRRDRPGHDPVPQRRSPGLLGRGSSPSPASPAPEPQTEERPGRRLPEGLLHRGRQRRRPHRYLPRRKAPPPVKVPSAPSPAPSSSSPGTCSPTLPQGSPTSALTGTSAKPTTTVRSAPTSASSRSSASASTSRSPPLPIPKTPLTRPVPRSATGRQTMRESGC